MLKAKSHLKNVTRANIEKITRKGFLRLDMNENVMGLPNNFVKRAISEINPDYLSSYPEYNKLVQKIALHNNLNPKNICLSNGSDAAIKYIFDAYVSERDKVLFATPSFAMYKVYCNIFRARPVTVEYNSNLSFPYKKFMDRIEKGIRIAIIVNPNNPTGSAIVCAQLMDIIEKTAKKNVLLIIDEAYFYFYPQTVIKKIEQFNNLIVLRTFSKLCGMASVRLGYAASCPEIIKNIKKVKPVFDVNGLAILFGEKLLENSQIIDNLIKSFYEGKDYLVKKLRGEGIEFKEGLANFILIKCRRPQDIIKEAKEKKILLGGNFKEVFLKDYIRVTIGSKTVMQHFWKVFIDIYKNE